MERAARFEVVTVEGPQCVRLELRGELDVLDVRDLTLLDAAGLRVSLESDNRIRWLTGPQPGPAGPQGAQGTSGPQGGSGAVGGSGPGGTSAAVPHARLIARRLNSNPF